MQDTEKRQMHRDFFLHLIGFITLYWSMIALITVLFQLVDKVFPDQLEYFGNADDPLRWGLSGVIVSFPVFVGIMIFFRRKEMKRPNFPIYFTLFVTALTAIVDVSVLIYRLTGGDITWRFVLKILAVLLVTGSVFAFEMWQLKRESFEMKLLPRLLTSFSYLLVLIAVVLGFIVVGSPASQRAVKYDMERINDLRALQYEILNFYDREDTLPSDLSSFRGGITKDPKTDESYEYRVVDEDTFEVCAVFDKDYEESNSSGYYPYMERAELFEYKAGKTCFERSVDWDDNGGFFKLKG
ncbi:TPA: hypothetical protein DDZ10_01350 [Candidatus Uhrbacteria bacterium]|uniref:DUF5671 domain-containing protein n=1 Tax=Candidatus Uhrbacteria bacterium GW2011_GWC2_53_7 TaxID=1618986 RepID=A0A0G1XYR1_9BACT|nr:MAG: hypothetical protein UY82_C0029G0003 [Candidatus Uhrbacteria bacterium GW2011_GWC2_53_7]OGL71611.1 MAG: hypothetical protein A3D69_02005 [Candidatus Uhrbacteria bacterium RIFCSPHIGHO2_02_FULL_54_11]HBL39297.1 hypothetical protein [Candidatus Uhrbacteria bacterium]